MTQEAKAWLAGVFDRAAPSYDEVAGGYHEHFGERLVDRAGVGPGDRVLDVACGRGAALVPAARIAGPDGSVLGIDLSPEMVRLAQVAIDRAGVHATAEVMDAEDLLLPDGVLDRVLCGFGVFFLPRPEEALAGFHRVLAPGGVVAISTWGEEDPRWTWEDELLADVEVERRALVRPFADADELRALVAGAGFVDVSVVAEDHEVRLADADEWWAWKWSYSLRGVLEQLPEARLERLRREADERIEAMQEPKGLPLRLTALVATGVRAG